MSARTHAQVHRRHQSFFHARTIGVLVGVTAMGVFLGACSREITEPTYDGKKRLAPEQASFALSGPAALNGRTVSIESARFNSSGQRVCLDFPWGNAFSGQDINYYPCHYQPAQQFVLSAWHAGSGQSWVVIKPASNANVCLDVRGGTSNGGEHMQLFTCKPLNSASAGNQIFLLPVATSPAANNTPLVTTICVMQGYPNFVLDVPLPMTVTSYVQQSQLNNGLNQLWRLRDVQTGQYFGGAAWNRC